MDPVLGSRKRFLYRVVVYSLLPVVGLFVALSHPDDGRGQAIGLAGLVLGGVALYLLFSRLRRPRSALRYALRPIATLRHALQTWSAQTEGTSLGSHLQGHLPDVAITERTAASKPIGPVSALALGEELLVVHATAPSSRAECDTLLAALEQLRTPIVEEPVVLALADPSPSGSAADLAPLAQQRGVHIARIPSRPPSGP